MSYFPARLVALPSEQAVTIRTANLADAQAMCTYLTTLWMDVDAFNVTAPGEVVPTVVMETQWIQTHLDDPDQLALVVETDGNIIGLANLEAASRQRLAHTARLGISLATDWRNQGIGTALMQTLLDWATDHAVIEKVTLEVLASNLRALHVYHSLGFLEEGRRYRAIRYEDGTYMDDLLMYRWVK